MVEVTTIYPQDTELAWHLQVQQQHPCASQKTVSQGTGREDVLSAMHQGKKEDQPEQWVRGSPLRKRLKTEEEGGSGA